MAGSPVTGLRVQRGNGLKVGVKDDCRRSQRRRTRLGVVTQSITSDKHVYSPWRHDSQTTGNYVVFAAACKISGSGALSSPMPAT